MASSDGPPAMNTCLASRAAQLRGTQSIPPHEGSQRHGQSNASARSENASPCKGSVLTSIADPPSNEIRQPEEGNVLSEQETICRATEENPEQEQSYMTVPGSFAESANLAGPRVPSPENHQSKERGHALSFPSQGED